MDQFDREFEEQLEKEIDGRGIPWYARLLLRVSPGLFMKIMARKHGVDHRKINYAMKLFQPTRRIDIEPLPSRSGRGFVLYLDNNYSLHFYQDGDHFYFDGFEIGQYENGDVTVFDRLD